LRSLKRKINNEPKKKKGDSEKIASKTGHVHGIMPLLA
jgi:hypothetical protein